MSSASSLYGTPRIGFTDVTYDNDNQRIFQNNASEVKADRTLCQEDRVTIN